MANLLWKQTGAGFLTFAKKQLSLAIATTLLPNMVLAQDQPDDSGFEVILEEVIVTGTRIVTEDGFGHSSPVTVVGMEKISSLGLTRVEDILNSLPQVEAAENAFLSNSATGTASIDLRGMGAKRTLVLVNGRRMQPGGLYSWAADVNQIPSQMIERVEVLTGGASAVYGADAVAGVVNFIMRRVDGVEFSAGIDGYQHDNRNRYIQDLMDEQGYEYPTGNTGIDGKGYNMSIAVGGDFLDGRGNATAYATWRKDEEFLQGSRDYSSCAVNRYGTACGGSWNTDIPNFFIAPRTEDGWGPFGYDYFQEEFLTLQPDNSLTPFDFDNPNLYNYAPVNFYRRPDERWSFGAFADYEINQHAVAYLETMYANDQTRAQIAESGTFFNDAYPLPLDNAYFPENFRQSLAELWPGEDDFGIYIGKRNVEGGPRSDILEHSGFRIVAGVKGVLAGDWDYDISYLYAQTDSSSNYVNDFLLPKIKPAVDSALCEADRSCIPYQVFTYQGVTPEAADSLEGTAVATSTTETDIFQAYVTGDTGWGLDAGNIMAVAGYEHRKVGYERRSDSIFEQGGLAGWGGWQLPSLAGGYSVNELFIETKIPLLADRRFSRDMVLDLAYRWSDYSTSGGSSTYRVGLDWQITDWLRLRTGYNRAVRAPNIEELFDSQQLGGFDDVDRCEGPQPEYTFEQCARSGVTAEQYGNMPEAPEFFWLQALYGGNTDLDPETADTITAGLVFQPSRNMQFSLDYWDIEIEGVIENMDPSVALEQCALDGQLCELIQRGPGGILWRGDDAYVLAINWNLGGLHHSGIDAAWTWSPGEQWLVDLIGTWYLKKETTYIPNDPDSSYDCVGRISDWLQCWPTPEWRHVASATYDSGSFWAVTGRWRYFGEITYDGTDDEIANDSLDAQNYLDLNAVFRFMDTHDLTLGINNVLDKEPPLLGSRLSTNGNTIAGFYDTLGRYLFARVTMRW